MAQFLNEEPPAAPEPDGFANMGKPIPEYRKQAAHDHAKAMGLDTARAQAVVSGMAEQLARDKPYEATAHGMRYVDLTGTYRLMAVLLTAEPAGAAPGNPLP